MPARSLDRLPVAQEWQEQAELMRWAALVEGREPRLALLHHIPNGEARAAKTAAKLQRMGVKPHIPDLFLPIATRHFDDDRQEGHVYHGCYVEMKRLLGRAGQDQRQMHDRLRMEGYVVHVAQGWLDAARALCWYLHRPDLAKELGDERKGVPHDSMASQVQTVPGGHRR